MSNFFTCSSSNKTPNKTGYQVCPSIPLPLWPILPFLHILSHVISLLLPHSTCPYLPLTSSPFLPLTLSPYLSPHVNFPCVVHHHQRPSSSSPAFPLRTPPTFTSWSLRLTLRYDFKDPKQASKKTHERDSNPLSLTKQKNTNEKNI